MIAKYNFLPHKKGDTFIGCNFQFIQNNAPMSLLGCAVKMQIRKTASSPVVLEWNTADDGIVIINPNFDTIHLNQKSGEDMNIPPFVYQYDLQITFPTGIIQTFIEGSFSIIEDITR